jgi:hypothetical protein
MKMPAREDAVSQPPIVCRSTSFAASRIMGRGCGAQAMPKPVTVTISHELGKEQAKERIRSSLGQIHAQIAPYVSSVEDRWIGDRLEFDVVAMGQTVTGGIEVFEELVRVEFVLPGILGFVTGLITAPVRDAATKLLEKK